MHIDVNVNIIAHNRKYILSETKNKLINHAEINWSDQSEPISAIFEDVYFNTDQGIDESFYVFIQGNNLKERWLNCQSEHFSIAETGFGTGLNFLVTCLHFEKFLSEYPDKPLKRLFFTSFEKYPLNKDDLIASLKRWPSLEKYVQLFIDQYPLPLTGCHRIPFSELNITLDLWFGDIIDTLPVVYIYPEGVFDSWYLDGFSPNKNPEMWTALLFKMIAQTCKEGATLATFTSAGFVRRALISSGFNMSKRKGYGKKREMLTGQINTEQIIPPQYANNFRSSGQITDKDIAIIGGGIASACLTLAMIKRGYKVTLYCQNKSIAEGASGNHQGALYPLLNKDHNNLSQFFSNSFLYARNYVEQINQTNLFDFDFSGLLQLYYDDTASAKLDKIIQANLPDTLVQKISSKKSDELSQIDIGQKALLYPLGGWLAPGQMTKAIFDKAQDQGHLIINVNSQLESFSKNTNGWKLKFKEKHKCHSLLILTTAMDTLLFEQSKAMPLSAARGQVTYIPTTPALNKLKVTLCHEGYLTPISNDKHCMGATFKRHDLTESFSQQEQQDNKQKLANCIPNKEWVEQINCDHKDSNVGIRCTTRDHFPYVGALADYEETQKQYKDAQTITPTNNAPFYDNLFVMTGLGSRGLCTAPLLAEMLASQINKEPLPFSTNILNSLQTNRQWINYLKKGKKLKI